MTGDTGRHLMRTLVVASIIMLTLGGEVLPEVDVAPCLREALSHRGSKTVVHLATTDGSTLKGVITEVRMVEQELLFRQMYEAGPARQIGFDEVSSIRYRRSRGFSPQWVALGVWFGFVAGGMINNSTDDSHPGGCGSGFVCGCAGNDREVLTVLASTAFGGFLGLILPPILDNETVECRLD